MDTKKMLIFTILALVLIQGASGAIQNIASLSASLVNQDPDPAIAGDIVEIRLGIENIGGAAAEDVYVTIKPEYPFNALDETNLTQRIGTIEGFQGKYDDNIKIIKYKLKVDKDATAGTYELKVSHGTKGSGVSTEKSLNIDVKNRESAEVIHIDKTDLIPGKQTPLKFTINNVGNAPLRDVTFTWENADKVVLPVGSDNTKYVKYIEMGSSAELDYNVVADGSATPGLYQLTLSLSYSDNTEVANKTTTVTKTLTSYAGVYVGGKTDFDVAFSESTGGATSFSIANIGATPATSVSVMIPDQRAWRVTGSNSVIIGNLNKGDYTVASFKLAPSQAVLAMMNASGAGGAGRMRGNGTWQGGASGQNGQGISGPGGIGLGTGQDRPARPSSNDTGDTINIQIAYTDTMGNRQLVEKTVKVGAQNIMGSDGAGSFGARRPTTTSTSQQIYDYALANIYYIVIGVILIGGYYGYGRYKRARRLDPNYKVADLFKKKKR